MTTELIFNEGWPIAPHASLAILALLIAIVHLLSPKGTPVHKILGYIWVAAMAIVAVSGLFIHEIRLWGLFSPIHILSFVVLTSLYFAITAARQGNIKRHRIIMLNLIGFALVLTGMFTLLPGRLMHDVFLG